MPAPRSTCATFKQHSSNEHGNCAAACCTILTIKQSDRYRRLLSRSRENVAKRYVFAVCLLGMPREESDVELLIAENQDDSFRIPEIQRSRLLITSRRFVSCPFDTVSVRLNSAFLHDAIALAEHDDAGLPVLDLMFGDIGEAHDGEDVTSFSLEGSRAVEDDLARTGIAGDGVGLEAISVCHIAAQDALVRYEPAFLHQVGGDGQAAFVLQIAICDCGAVNLRF